MRIIKIQSLDPAYKTWIDRDEIMLHACFQILKDCVEKERVDTHCNYETHKEFVDEVRFLYNWWLSRMNNTDPIENMEEDNEMLIRLIKIRGQLWT